LSSIRSCENGDDGDAEPPVMREEKRHRENEERHLGEK
jgi:hypothetical protein